MSHWLSPCYRVIFKEKKVYFRTQRPYSFWVPFDSGKLLSGNWFSDLGCSILDPRSKAQWELTHYLINRSVRCLTLPKSFASYFVPLPFRKLLSLLRFNTRDYLLARASKCSIFFSPRELWARLSYNPYLPIDCSSACKKNTSYLSDQLDFF